MSRVEFWAVGRKIQVDRHLMEVKIGQVWKHKRRGQLLKVEAVGDDGITLREMERSSTSPSEGTVYKMSTVMLTILWEIQSEESK